MIVSLESKARRRVCKFGVCSRPLRRGLNGKGVLHALHAASIGTMALAGALLLFGALRDTARLVGAFKVGGLEFLDASERRVYRMKPRRLMKGRRGRKTDLPFSLSSF